VSDKRAIAAVAALIGLLAGLVAGGIWIGTDQGVQALPEPSPGVAHAQQDGLTAEIGRLRSEIADERAGRFTLAAEVDQIRWALEQIAPTLPLAQREGAATLPLVAPGAGNAETAKTKPPQNWFDESQLLEAGFDGDEIERLRDRYDAYKMEELYLRDEATREGWAGRGRVRMETQAIRNSFRSEVGDPAYDMVLFATGENNRVRLVDTLATSPARAANLQSGDLILRYAGENIFTVADLQASSRSGKAGGTIAIDVMRGGETVRLYLPRGPLGARLAPARGTPTSTR
jgi:hypothetical protein